MRIINNAARVREALQDYSQRLNDGTPLLDPYSLDLPNDFETDEANLRIALYAALRGMGHRFDKVNVPDDALFAQERLSPANISRIIEDVFGPRPTYAELLFPELAKQTKRAAHLSACAADPKCGDLTFFPPHVLGAMYDSPAKVASMARFFALNGEDPRPLWRAILAYGQIVQHCIESQRILDPGDLRRIASHVTDIFLASRKLNEA